MRRFLVLLVGLALTAGLALAQDPPQPEAPPEPVMARLRDRLNPEFPPWAPAHVVERCAEHLATINAADQVRIRYFDLSDVPRATLPSATAVLFFGCNSAARAFLTQQPRPVPNADNRLFWVDLGWYNWTPEVWERIAQEDPYFREPIVPSSSVGLGYLRNTTRANAVLRASWFLWYVFDNGEFINSAANPNFNEKSFYYQLVYANVAFTREAPDKTKLAVKGTGPRNAAEFQAAWRVSFDHLKEFPVDRGAMVDTGASAVAYNNRILWRVRTPLGVYWRTFDVFRTAGDQDFLESPFPKQFDAGEHIVQDERGAQFYLLTNGKDEAVDFANPFVVKGDPAGPHNTVLVTARSCIHCHDTGILAFRNEHTLTQRAGLELRADSPERAERFRQFFLQEKKLRKLVIQDQDNYRDFIGDCNGLTSEENTVQFARFRAWYGAPVTLAQAARELGAQPQELADALGFQATKGRLGQLALTGQPVPRSAWERGGFQEAGLLLIEWRRRPLPAKAVTR